MLMAGLDGIKNKIHPGDGQRTSTTCRRIASLRRELTPARY
jgi:glutamine synthetase